MGSKGIVGLANIGNTCYANSTIQALRHTEELTNYLLQEKHIPLIQGKDNHEAKFVEAYTDLIKCLSTADGPGFIRPMGFLKPMQSSARASGFDNFCGRGQEDSHEFLVFVMDMLHEGLKKEIPMTIDIPPSITEKALSAWRDAFTKSYSPLVDIFFGLHLLTTTCQGCKTSTHRFETFNCLKGALEGDEPHTISEYLRNELKEETIEGFDCSKCSPIRQNAVLRRSYWKLPTCLAIAIKRFHGVGHKKTNAIVTPKEPIGFEEFFSPDSQEYSKSKKYQPYAMVDHHGSYFGGHYVTQALSANKGWFLYDDETTHELKEGPMFGKNTYIVFLRQMD